MVESQSRCDETLIHQAVTSAAPDISLVLQPTSVSTSDVSALAFSDEVLQQLLTMLIKPEPAVQPIQLPVIAEAPGTTSPQPPVKPCPNVLQNRSFPLCPQSAVRPSSIVEPATIIGRKIAPVVSADAAAAESRSWDSLIQLLMGNSGGESRRNSTGSLKGQATASGFRVPQVLCAFSAAASCCVSVSVFVENTSVTLGFLSRFRGTYGFCEHQPGVLLVASTAEIFEKYCAEGQR